MARTVQHIKTASNPGKRPSKAKSWRENRKKKSRFINRKVKVQVLISASVTTKDRQPVHIQSSSDFGSYAVGMHTATSMRRPM